MEIIEGGTEVGEEPLKAIQRELVEEAGLVAESWQPLGGEVHLSNCISAEVAMLFLAQGLTEVESAPEGTEVLTIKRLPLSKCLEMAESGEIKDSMSIIAIFRLDALIKAGKLKQLP